MLDALKKVAASQIEELEKQGAISRNTKEAAAGQEAGEVGGEIAAATEAGPILKILFAFNNPDRILIREIFAPSFRTVIGQTLLECGIAEGNSDWKSPANIKKFTQAVRSRFGIVLEINPENFQTAGELQEAVVESVDELLDQAATDGQAKSRLRDILQARVSELQYQLESLRQEIEGNPALASQAAALRDNLERIIAREMCFILAEGERPVRRYNPIVANQRTGRPETGGTRTRIFTPRVRTVSCLGLRSGSRLPLLKVTAQPMPQPSDEAYKNRVEKILEHKIRALVDSGQDSADSTIQIKTADGRTLTFSLIQLDSDPGGRFFGIRALNHFLATLGPADSKSKKRIYFNPDTGEYIFGNARETHPQPETFTVASDKHAGLKKFFDENKEKFGNKYSFDEATGVLTVKGVMTAEEMSGGALGQFFNDTEMRTLYEQTKTMQRIVVFETEDVISPSIRDQAVAFVPRIPTNNFGTPDNCGECFETVIRQPAQEGFYRMLTEAALDRKSVV